MRLVESRLSSKAVVVTSLNSTGGADVDEKISYDFQCSVPCS